MPSNEELLALLREAVEAAEADDQGAHRTLCGAKIDDTPAEEMEHCTCYYARALRLLRLGPMGDRGERVPFEEAFPRG